MPPRPVLVYTKKDKTPSFLLFQTTNPVPPIHEWIRENARRSIQEIYVAGYATSSGYASSAGSATEIPVSISAPETANVLNGTAKMLIFPNSKLKIAYGTIGTKRQTYGTHTFPVAFTYAVRAINCNPSVLDATSIRSPHCSGDEYCYWSYMVMGY